MFCTFSSFPLCSSNNCGILRNESTGKLTDRACRLTSAHERERERERERQTDRQTDRQTVVCWLLNVPATCECMSDRETDTERQTQADRQTETERGATDKHTQTQPQNSHKFLCTDTDGDKHALSPDSPPSHPGTQRGHEGDRETQ